MGKKLTVLMLDDFFIMFGIFRNFESSSTSSITESAKFL